MAPAIDANVPFHRSHSTPDLLSGPPNRPSAVSISSSVSPDQENHRTLSLKSLPSLPAFDVPSIDFDFEFDHDFKTSLRFDTKGLTDDSKPVTNDKSLKKTTTAKLTHLAVPAKPDKVSKKKSMIDRHRWLPRTKSSPDVRIVDDRVVPDTPKIPNGVAIMDMAAAPEPPKPLDRSRTRESLAGLARRSWMSSSSRSPSPSPKKEKKDPNRQRTVSYGKKAKHEPGVDADPSGTPKDTHAGLTGVPAETSSSTGRAFNRASVYLTKMGKKPQSVFVRSASSLSLSSTSSLNNKNGDNSDDHTAPSASSTATTSAPGIDNTLSIPNNLTISPLNHRNSSQTTSSTTTDHTGASDPASSQLTADTSLTMPHPTSHDPLWSTFRRLDADYAAFASKPSTAAKMTHLRGTLVPFLRATAGHASNSDRAALSPEDVDRRAAILNRWWNGLLEMLDGGAAQSALAGMRAGGGGGGVWAATSHMNNMQPVAGVDRPALLEATTMIMTRPEWRLGTAGSQPLAERSPAGAAGRPRSGTQSSAEGGDEDGDAWAPGGGEALVESAEHNVRTMFVANLTGQMALVVEKMSMRHAPSSLVNWSGKAAAYAFFFAPGVADVLVRLWGLRPETVRRVADEIGLPRRSRGESEDLVALFPPNLGEMGWASAKAVCDKLRSPAKMPLLVGKIQWHGPWVSRWRGGDTDLLFIFCKYYYILAEEFMPAGLSLVEKARAPAFVLLHAQLLANLDGSIQRQGPVDGFGPPVGDGVYGADASMSALSLPPYNLMKGMGENRLVILLKDMLADNTVGVVPSVKLTFAEAFMAVTKSATKKTSRYEHTAMFMLCDFLEEVLGTYTYYQGTLNNSYATSPSQESFPAFEFEAASTRKHVDFIDWPFWFDVCRLMLDSNNTMAEIRVLSFVFTTWDAIVAVPARKKALCIDWMLSEETFDKFFNNWCPMIRAYYMRLLCWRICRDSGSANELDEQIFLLASQRLKTVFAHYLWMKQTAEAGASQPTSTAPCHPTPGKRFMIIRTEVQTPQPGLFVGFDQFPTSFSTTDETHNPPAVGAPEAKPDKDYKKKWSLLGKVLSMTAGAAAGVNMAGGNIKRSWDNEDLEQVRKETAASRASKAGPPPPPKQAPVTGVASSSDSNSSTGSAPIYDEVQYQFRFTLTWQNHAASTAGPPRDRVLTRPKLPALAQSRASSKQQSNERKGEAGRDTPPPAAGRPPATRGISGDMQSTGLVTEARNATPGTPRPALATHSRMDSVDSYDSISSDEASSTQPPEFSFSDTPQLELKDLTIRPVCSSSDTDPSTPTSSDHQSPTEVGTTDISGVQPLRPTGIYTANATYAGRALAEWGIVVAECNNFVERRRDEGVLGLGDVEVPNLGVDGLGMRAFGGRA